MKKVILASVVAVAAISGSGVAEAATVSVCNAGSVLSFSWSTTTGQFVQSPFNGRCSRNVHLVGDDNSSFFRVGATSVKGKQAFGGSTTGGGITGANCASATGCINTDANNAATSASSS